MCSCQVVEPPAARRGRQHSSYKWMHQIMHSCICICICISICRCICICRQLHLSHWLFIFLSETQWYTCAWLHIWMQKCALWHAVMHNLTIAGVKPPTDVSSGISADVAKQGNIKDKIKISNVIAVQSADSMSHIVRILSDFLRQMNSAIFPDLAQDVVTLEVLEVTMAYDYWGKSDLRIMLSGFGRSIRSK